MDLSSSSSRQQYDQDQHNHHRLEIQERDWLSCSTSTRTTTTSSRDIDIEDDNRDKVVVVVEREHMFDKVVTPSDVGKLNRLVIPKQHAEKYFPLDTTNNNNGNTSSSSCGNSESKAGLLLNFEDRTGKSWRFRYSYWNSSQSYVMTKGWSRFVKEKQLSAGDIVSFQRAVGDDIHSKNTFFIDWRRRPLDYHHHHHLGTAFSVHHSIPTWRSGGGSSSTTPTFFLRSHPHEPHPYNSLWDHSNIINNNSHNNNINSHLSPINGNIRSMAPYNHSGPVFGSGFESESNSRSLILLRSPVPNSGLINPHPYLMPNPHHVSNSPWTSNNDILQGNVRRDEPPKLYDSAPIVHGIAPSPSGGGGSGGFGKRSLRLFGVNMEYDQLNSGSKSMGISTTLSMLSNPSTSNLDDPQNSSSPSKHSFRHG